MPTNTGIVPITPSSSPTSQAANWSVDSANNPVWVVTLDNGSVEYYDYPGGSIITPTLPLSPLTETDFEIASFPICVNNQNWLLCEIWDNSTGTAQSTGVQFFKNNVGSTVPTPPNYNMGSCYGQSLPGLDKISNVSDGVYTFGFNADKVTVAYDTFTTSTITVKLIGAIQGSGEYDVINNNAETHTFNSAVITGVEITGAIGNFVTIEYSSK